MNFKITDSRYNKFKSDLNSLLNEYFYYNPTQSEVFKLLNRYLSENLDNIEKVANNQKDQAIQRTLLYVGHDILDKFKKSKSEKNKEKMIFKIVNTFVLECPDENCIDSSGSIKEMYNIILEYKEKILSNERWYLQVIPESKWLIKHLKEIQ